MSVRGLVGLGLGLAIVTALIAADVPKAGAAPFDVTSTSLPGAPADGVLLDYLAVDGVAFVSRSKEVRVATRPGITRSRSST